MQKFFSFFFENQLSTRIEKHLNGWRVYEDSRTMYVYLIDTKQLCKWTLPKPCRQMLQIN